MKKVIFIHRVTCDYSKEFLKGLFDNLLRQDIYFQVFSGQSWQDEELVDVLNDFSFGIRGKNVKIIGKLFWMKGMIKAIKGADIIIIEQLSSLLNTYLLFLYRQYELTCQKIFNKKRTFKLAYYGHGKTFAATKNNRIATKWKNLFIHQVDWWFTYSDLSRDILLSEKYPSQKITVFQNTVNVREIINTKQKYSICDKNELIKKVFSQNYIQHNESTFLTNEIPFIGIFCGRLVEYKEINFLLKALVLIKKRIPNFFMLIIGAGPDSKIVEEFCKDRQWCVWVGKKIGSERVPYLLLADIYLNPGAIGLNIIDSFAAGIPIVTTNIELHGPEIFYLKNEINGIITEFNVEEYAKRVINLYKDSDRLCEMKINSQKDSKNYTIENMITRFETGLLNLMSEK